MNAILLLATAALGLGAAQARPDPCAAGPRACTDVDYGQTILLQGTVQHVEWTTPYAIVHLKVEKTQPMEAPGGVWRVRGPSPNTLIRGGLTKDALTMGRDIVVRGQAFKDMDCARGCRLHAQDIQRRCNPIVGFVPPGSMRCTDIHESPPLRWTR